MTLCIGTCRIQTHVYCAHLRCNRPACKHHSARFCINCISHAPTQGQYLEKESLAIGQGSGILPDELSRVNEVTIQNLEGADSEAIDECITINTHDDTSLSNIPEINKNRPTLPLKNEVDLLDSESQSSGTWKGGIKSDKVKLNAFCWLSIDEVSAELIYSIYTYLRCRTTCLT